jgi:hypothetical protein
MAAGAAYLGGASPDQWQQQTTRALARPMRVAGWAWRLGENPRWNRAGVAALATAPTLMQAIARLTRVRD